MEENKNKSESQNNENTDLKSTNRLNAIVAYIPFLCFIPLFGENNNEFTKKHGKQGLILLIIEIIAMLMLLPIGAFLWKIVLLACLALAIAGIITAFSGKEFKIPFIGDFADKI